MGPCTQGEDLEGVVGPGFNLTQVQLLEPFGAKTSRWRSTFSLCILPFKEIISKSFLKENTNKLRDEAETV